ncbi:MAG: hypothetical protein MZV70_45155 [Desulfobacterales bacterium]|nr:hypothetical protein [Desulfobacterales bacterium]
MNHNRKQGYRVWLVKMLGIVVTASVLAGPAQAQDDQAAELRQEAGKPDC